MWARTTNISYVKLCSYFRLNFRIVIVVECVCSIENRIDSECVIRFTFRFAKQIDDILIIRALCVTHSLATSSWKENLRAQIVPFEPNSNFDFAMTAENTRKRKKKLSLFVCVVNNRIVECHSKFKYKTIFINRLPSSFGPSHKCLLHLRRRSIQSKDCSVGRLSSMELLCKCIAFISDSQQFIFVMKSSIKRASISATRSWHLIRW